MTGRRYVLGIATLLVSAWFLQVVAHPSLPNLLLWASWSVAALAIISIGFNVTDQVLSGTSTMTAAGAKLGVAVFAFMAAQLMIPAVFEFFGRALGEGGLVFIVSALLWIPLGALLIASFIGRVHFVRRIGR